MHEILRRGAKKAAAKEAGAFTLDPPFVFTTAEGKPFRKDSIGQAFKRASVRAGLLNMYLYDLRHNYASLLYDAGVDVFTACKHLGHADPKTTMAIYTHLKARRKRYGAHLVNLVFSGLDEKLPGGCFWKEA